MKKAFTLSEVLITLGIIGVVAALTLPSLIAKHKEKVLAVGVRKAYSDFSNALRLSQAEFDGNIDYSTVFNPNNTSYESAAALSKYFNGAKICESSNQKGCAQYYTKVKFAQAYKAGTDKNSEYQQWLPAIILNNGTTFFIQQIQNPDCFGTSSWHQWDENGTPLYNEDGSPLISTSTTNVCAYVYMDINGSKLPNRYGLDNYRINVTKTKLLPGGQTYEGSKSFQNILAGDDKFIYTDYKIGE